ncbi:MAG TPA: ABC transporter permease [Chitinophagaceae bacterium]|nr:ABC transporter permease [Chitinophagaceae bacterium]
MFKNYFKTAWRNLMKNKTFSFINILGLGLGIACSIFIFLWVQDERSFDDFNTNGSRLYRVMLNDKDKNGNITNTMDASTGLLADALKKQIPEVTDAAMVVWDNDMLFTVGNKIGKEKGRYAGADFFNMFSFPLLQGNAKTVLASPDNIVISQKLAQNYFGKENPVGKAIRIDDKRNYIVSGVVANVPENSSIQFDFVLPIQHCFEDNQWMVSGWSHYGPPTYIMLRADASADKVNAKIKNFMEQQDKTVNDKTLSLQPYKDMYLYSSFTNGVADGGRIEYVRLFSIISVFILLIACINFMNLATARSVKRAKEVGVRKVVGAAKKLLFTQFLAEALLTTFIAVIVAVALVFLILPEFNAITEKHLTLHIENPSLILSLFGLTIVTGFVAGSYPALFLSSLNPISVLKGALKFKHSNTIFRKGLVVFQFTLSIILIVSTAIVYKQMNYVQTKNLGLDRSNVIYVPLIGDLGKNYDAFKNDVLQSGHIENISQSSSIPSGVGWWSDNINWNGKLPDDKTAMKELDVSYDFIKTMKMELADGRDFSPTFGTDTANFLINEAAAKAMNMQHAVGEIFSHQQTKGKIIGVVKDFHTSSLHDPIVPMFITLQPKMEQGVAVIRTQAGSTTQVLSNLKTAWKKFNPKYPFDYIFADDNFKQQYHSEMMVAQLANVFAFLAIFISCMGLFGLSMFVAEQRTREIGIRKVLGASVAGITTMMSKDFIALVAIASVIAFPVAWWVMNNWLQGFAYKTTISWWLFVSAGFTAMLIALITISFQAIKAAIANPVKSLRTE